MKYIVEERREAPVGDIPECPTLEQKALALIQGKLWYRIGKSAKWETLTDKRYECLILDDAEYFIGESPYNFNEVERIMFDALQRIKMTAYTVTAREVALEAIEEVLNIKIQKS